MSDIFQQDISDPNSSPNMQQQEPKTHTHIHNKEGNEATNPDPTSPSLKVEEDERVAKVPPSSVIKRGYENGPGSLSLKKKKKQMRLRERTRLPLPQEYRIVLGGNVNGPVSLSPPNYRICLKGNGWKSHLRHVFPTRRV
ncbi:hypothetical protein P9112_010710 [Eukaryota sp. TZLM1-RC]